MTTTPLSLDAEFDTAVAKIREQIPAGKLTCPAKQFIFKVTSRNPTPATAGTLQQVHCGCHLCGQRAMQAKDADNEFARLRLYETDLSELPAKGESKALKDIASEKANELHKFYVEQGELILADVCRSNVKNRYLVCDACVAKHQIRLETCCSCKNSTAFYTSSTETAGVRHMLNGKDYFLCKNCAGNKFDCKRCKTREVHAHGEKCCNCDKYADLTPAVGMPLSGINITVAECTSSVCANCVLSEPTDKIVNALKVRFRGFEAGANEMRIRTTTNAWDKVLKVGLEIVDAARADPKFDVKLWDAFDVVTKVAKEIDETKKEIVAKQDKANALRDMWNIQKRLREDDEEVEGPQGKKRGKETEPDSAVVGEESEVEDDE